MKTSLTEIKQIDDHIANQLADGDKLIFDARLILDPMLRFNLSMQRKLYALVKAYARRALRSEVSRAQSKVFQDDSFRNEIHTIFTKP